MRLGAPVEGWTDAKSWAERHAEKGYGAAYWPLPDASPDEAEFVREANSHDIAIAEVGVWNNLLDPDPVKKRANFERAVQRLATAERVGARCCVNISGSRSAVWDGPHKDNLTRETFDEIVHVTRAIIDEVKPARAHYALEPMPWMYPTDLESTRRLLDAVERDAFGVHVDMCNMMNTPDKVYRSGEITREYFRALAPFIHSVHAKDTLLCAKLTTHIDEAVPGEGMFDYDALLSECAALPDVCVMAEHLSSQALYDKAIAFIRRRAEALGLPFTLPT